MWAKFRRHKLAMVSGVVVILLYVVALFVEVLAPYNGPESQEAQNAYHPPTPYPYPRCRADNFTFRLSMAATSKRES